MSIKTYLNVSTDISRLNLALIGVDNEKINLELILEIILTGLKNHYDPETQFRVLRDRLLVLNNEDQIQALMIKIIPLVVGVYRDIRSNPILMTKNVINLYYDDKTLVAEFEE